MTQQDCFRLAKRCDNQDFLCGISQMNIFQPVIEIQGQIGNFIRRNIQMKPLLDQQREV